MDPDMHSRIATGVGFIAALDQSGGSTPRALQRYGVPDSWWEDEDAMFDLVHGMRARIMTSPAFDGDRILATILFRQTMERTVEGQDTAEYLWTRKRIVPFVKVDQGLEEARDGVRLMKPLTDLSDLLERARHHGVFGTKMRSVVLEPNETGVEAIVAQQFDVARRILDAGLVPIIEPEVDIHSPEKRATEKLLGSTLLAALDELDELAEGQDVMLKLTLPEDPGALGDLLAHPRVLRVAALSGGYTREEAVPRLAANPGVIASFSRALTEGLTVEMDDATFDAELDASIAEIYEASAT